MSIHLPWNVAAANKESILSVIVHDQYTFSHIGGLVQDCSISSALALEILQPCTKPSIYQTTIFLNTKGYTLLQHQFSRPCMHVHMGVMSPWWTTLELLNWPSIIQSSDCNWFKYWVLDDDILPIPSPQMNCSGLARMGGTRVIIPVIHYRATLVRDC